MNIPKERLKKNRSENPPADDYDPSSAESRE